MLMCMYKYLAVKLVTYVAEFTHLPTNSRQDPSAYSLSFVIDHRLSFATSAFQTATELIWSPLNYQLWNSAAESVVGTVNDCF